VGGGKPGLFKQLARAKNKTHSKLEKFDSQRFSRRDKLM
jgi:hypothetical protein